MSAPSTNLATLVATDSVVASSNAVVASSVASVTNSNSAASSTATSAVPAATSITDAVVSSVVASSAVVTSATSAAASTTSIASTTQVASTTSVASSTTAPTTTSSVATTPTTSSVVVTTPTSVVTTSTSSTIAATPTTTSVPVTTSTSTTSSQSRSTLVKTITTTESGGATITSTVATSTASSSGTSSGSSHSGLSDGARIAIAVVIPVAVVAALLAGGLWWWKRRKATQAAEEERRKEVEDYSYNPNANPTLPGVAGMATDGAYEMRQDSNAGYRGWGTTTVSSNGRKASTTLSGPVAGAFSDGTATSHGGPVSDARSGDRLIDQTGSYSPEGEILGAMAANGAHAGGDVHRGLSNASSTYSAAGRSDGSGDAGIGVAYSGGNSQYYDQYGSANPYEVQYGQEGYNGPGMSEMAGSAPVIRDNPARRNTRIENPAHFPQQSVGIAQNF